MALIDAQQYLLRGSLVPDKFTDYISVVMPL